ncbi:toxin-antitoxin system YwqK family antitoxin [Fusobacterium ulcerans]|mgnify:CR=1 FL=1
MYEKGILIERGTFKNGKRDGLTERFHNDSGKIMESANYKNGVIEGEFKTYYPNGKLEGEVNYKNGNPNGECKGYYENKNIKFTGSFKEGLPDGIWRHYSENGEIIEEKLFKDEELVSSE